MRTRFWYGSDGQRYKREDGGKRTLYLGNVEIVTDAGVTTVKRTVAGVLLQTVTGSATTDYYLFHDQLGNLVKITNASGAVVNSQDYAALGLRRDVDTQTSNGGTVPSLTTRGFTGHEMVDGVLNLIHMNGRLFDPGLGRFLQADPVIQAPADAQSWNAYTYCLNNPLTYTDPTGMISQGVRQAFAFVIGIVAAYFGQYYISRDMFAVAFAVSAGGAFVAGAVASQSLKGGLQAAFGAALTFGVGMAGWNEWQTIGAQMVSGGIMESLQGGNFGNGFFAAGLTALTMPRVGRIDNNIGRTIVGALVGGTISEATGGKFANGAISGAIQAAMAGGESENAEDSQFAYQDKNPVGQYAKTREVRQAYLELMVKRYQLGDPSNYEYVDDPMEINQGAWMDTAPSGKVHVYPSAFQDLSYYNFGSALFHEYVHVQRFDIYRTAHYSVGPSSRKSGAYQNAYMMEAEAYSKMLTSSNPFSRGMTSAFRTGMMANNIQYGYGGLTPANQAHADAGKFNCSVVGC